VPQLDTWFGKFVCAFAVGLGFRTGNLDDAFNLCLFISTHDL